MKKINIAIDGPSAAGKSSVAKAISKELGYIYVDTGALYRVVGFAAAQKGIDTKNASLVSEILPNTKVEMRYIDSVQCMFLNGENVTDKIRQPNIAMAASDVSAHKEVRAFLLDLQRSLAKDGGAIMDGRDIGTVVLPNAELKIYLTATAEKRTERRLAEHIAKGDNVDFDTLLKQINERDYNDSNRKEAPLKQAEDAILLDNTHLNLEEVISQIIALVKERC